ncbi:DUF5615 family PIN-like protein [Caulobacter sp. 17J65-9]|uniref:DUF5615 family PIN-like protein n=1 Tax=Caulobacter sp. 17J65-9 TaxID=2709382 RepID=UPI0032047B04
MSPLRLLCDEMLFRLARSLRAAGYDTVLAADGAPDRDLLERCRREDRVLVTRDRKLMAQALPDVRAVLLVDEDREAEARALSRALDIDWLLAPMSRCMVDNTPLSPAGPADLARVPSTVEASPEAVKVCRTCGRVYWPGGHVKRLMEKLSCWAREARD